MLVKMLNGEEKLKFSPNKYWMIIRFRTLVTGDSVYNLYDEEYRHPQMSIDRLGAEAIVKLGDWIVIRYKKRIGEHFATRVGQFIAILQQLAEMHEDEYVHGDDRCLNLIFGPEREKEQGTLIDFGLSGVEEKRRVREGILQDSQRFDDGKRHSGARPDSWLLKTHDHFLPSTVMRLHEYKKEEWRGVIERVEKEDDESLAASLESIEHFVLQPQYSIQT